MITKIRQFIKSKIDEYYEDQTKLFTKKEIQDHLLSKGNRFYFHHITRVK